MLSHHQTADQNEDINILTLKEKHSLSVFENRVLRRIWPAEE
jgi:hypothetical protein